MVYSDVRKVKAGAVFRAVDDVAMQAAVVQASRGDEISKTENIKNGITSQSYKIGTGETRQLLLDGSFKIPKQDEDMEAGWRSYSQSDAECKLTDARIVLTFAAVQKTAGFTIYFDDKADEYASKFKITAYLNSTKKGEKVIKNHSACASINWNLKAFNKIEIEFTETNNPERKVRVTEILLGIVENFDERRVASLRIMREIAPTMMSFPACECEISFVDLEGQYDPINQNSIIHFLQGKNAVTPVIAIDGVHSMGKYYFKELRINGYGSVTIIAQDFAGFLDEYSTGTLTSVGNTTLKRAVESILYFAPPPANEIKCVFRDGVGNTIVRETYNDISYREYLRRLAQAARTVCFFNKDGALEFVCPASAGGEELTKHNLLTPPALEFAERYTSCIIKNDSGQEIGRASLAAESESEKVLEVVNSNVVDGQAVAQWILLNGIAQSYTFQNRGNPCVDVGSPIRVKLGDKTISGRLYSQTFYYDGGLTESRKIAR